MGIFRDNGDGVLHKFLDFCATLRGGVVVFQGDSDASDQTDVITEASLADANVVTSQVKVLGAEVHKPVLDIDMPCLLLDTSTPGHHHLIIDKELTWDQYEDILKTLGRHGILQKGFVDASIRRKRTQVRTPWTRKEKAQW